MDADDKSFVTWVTASVVLYAVSTFITFLRLHERWQRKWRAADYATIGAFLASTFFTIAVLFARIIVRKPGVSLYQLGISNYPFAISQCIVIGVTKVAILLLFLELEPGRWHRWAIVVALVLNILWTITFFMLILFGCVFTGYGHLFSLLHSPNSVTQVDMQTFRPGDYKCQIHSRPIWIQSGYNVGIELTIFLLSLPFVYKVKANLATRIGLVMAFMLGFFTIAASVICADLVTSGFKNLRAPDSQSKVFTGALWSLAEVHGALLFASLLPMRGKIVKFCSRRLASFGYLVTTRGSQDSDTSFFSFFKKRSDLVTPIQVMSPTKRASLDDFIPYVAPSITDECPIMAPEPAVLKSRTDHPVPIVRDMNGNTWTEPAL